MTTENDNRIQKDGEAIPSNQQHIGRRIWSIIALVMSVLALLLSIGGIAGTWIGRSTAISIVTDVTTGIDQLTVTGRQGISQTDSLLVDVNVVIEAVEDTTSNVSENVAEEGFFVDLLPENTVEDLGMLSERIRSTLDNVLSVLEAATDLFEAVNELPLIDIEPPEEVAIIRDQIEEVLAAIEQLRDDITQFRENTAENIAAVSSTVSLINDRLETAQEGLDNVDDRLVTLQAEANKIKEQFPGWATTIAVILTLFLLWVIFAMVRLILVHSAELQAARQQTNAAAISDTAEKEDNSISSSE